MPITETVKTEIGKRLFEQNMNLNKVQEQKTELSKIYDPSIFINGPSTYLAVHQPAKSSYWILKSQFLNKISLQWMTYNCHFFIVINSIWTYREMEGIYFNMSKCMSCACFWVCFNHSPAPVSPMVQQKTYRADGNDDQEYLLPSSQNLALHLWHWRR